jgi:hypothetical protein
LPRKQTRALRADLGGGGQDGRERRGGHRAQRLVGGQPGHRGRGPIHPAPRAGVADPHARVDPAATAAFEMAASPEDTASDELAVAWTKAYGRDPDLSDAWDHAIKAVEAVLIPIVVPTQAGAHIGHVIGQLDRQGEQWNTLLRFNQTTPPVTRRPRRCRPSSACFG